MRRRQISLLAITALAVAGVVSIPAPANGASALRPSILSVSPSVGGTQARQHVIITGHNFTHVKSVYFGHIRASAIDVLGPGTIAAYAPAQAKSTRNIVVTTSSGKSKTDGADHYTYIDGGRIPVTGLAPTIAFFPPNASKTGVAAEISRWSCGTAGHCVAVSDYYPKGEELRRADAYTRTPSGITAAPIPTTSDDGSVVFTLYDVSCSGPDFCAAVGEDRNLDPVVATLHTGTWTTDHLPALSGPGALPYPAKITAVSCAAPGFCVAVGETSSGQAQGLIATLADGTWTVQTAPQPADGDTPSYAHLTNVSCPSTTWCEATGDFTSGGREDGSYALTDSAGTLSAVELLDPDGEYGDNPLIDELTCPAVAHCLAVGYYHPEDVPRIIGEVEVLSGTTWTSIAVHNPADVGEGMLLTGLTCTSTSFCIAAGSYDTRKSATKADEGILATIEGTDVTSLVAPAPRTAPLTAPVQLDAIACHSSTSCVAVGSAGKYALTEVYTKPGVWVPAPTSQINGVPQGARTIWNNATSPAYGSFLLSGELADHFDDGDPTDFSAVLANGVPK